MSANHTAHINALPEDFAQTVLMPGDPLRSEFIAKNFLSEIRLVNNVRAVQGYTGLYKGERISVMASGMGMPSIGIYSYELFNFFGVENIIRVGSAGSYRENVKIMDIVLAQGACTDSAYAKQFGLPGDFAPIADYSLLKKAQEKAEQAGLNYHIGNVISSDRFYGDSGNPAADWGKMGVLAVEMEAAALYMNAARSGKKALCICTISDHLLSGEQTSAAERQTAFGDMITLALETGI